jgi:uncharacterized protein YecT (DUF1311 family)
MYLLAALALSAAAPARATDFDAAIERYAKSCDAASSTVETAQCFDRQLQRADKELNDTWAKVLQSIDEYPDMPAKDKRTWREAIKAGQRAWVAFKQLECRGSAPYKYFGGTQSHVEPLACELGVTVIRAEQLKDYLGVGY